MRMIGISTTNDLAVGLRLAGVECFVMKDPESIKSKIKEVANDKEVGILNVTKKIYSLAKEELDKISDTQDLPLIVTIPGEE